ncbi:MAG: VWA domain-containing protein [Pseudoruegeria sp.]
MIELSLFFDAFHFMRPLWLLTLPFIVSLWWITRRLQNHELSYEQHLPPHLASALTVGNLHPKRFQPIDIVALVLLCTALGASGPTWSRVPNPFVSQTAPLVVVLDVSTTMESDDIAPTRLERGKQKIRDLIKERAGGRTALIAYAGTAHRVVPYTEDPDVMTPYLDGLEPDTMPVDGNNATDALILAQSLVQAENGTSGILFVLSQLKQSDATAFQEGNLSSQIAFLQITPDGVSGGALDGLPSLITQRVTPDPGDIQAINRRLNAAYQASLLQDDRQQWDDRGWLFAWPAALLMLLWFRRGMTMPWAMALAALMLATPSGPARAEGGADWFFTPDQQGQIAYNRKKFTDSAAHFQDPMWHAYALYRDGKYEAAATGFARIDTAEAAIGEGLAQIKNRNYRDGVRAFERALTIEPNNEKAQNNLKVAETIVTYIEETRAQSDTGEDTGLGADDVVFDNESGMGADTQIQVEGKETLLTTEQWMNTVDTRAGDFLRQRFAQEAAGANQ